MIDFGFLCHKYKSILYLLECLDLMWNLLCEQYSDLYPIESQILIVIHEHMLNLHSLECLSPMCVILCYT